MSSLRVGSVKGSRGGRWWGARLLWAPAVVALSLIPALTIDSGTAGAAGPPAITVTPDTGLGLNPTVQVGGSGWSNPPGQQVFFAECIGATINPANCVQVGGSASIDATGSFSPVPVVVQRVVQSQDCSVHSCQLVALWPLSSTPTEFATHPLSFDPNIPLPPQSATVSGTVTLGGPYPAGTTVGAAACPAPGHEPNCPGRQFVYADSPGHYTLTLSPGTYNIVGFAVVVGTGFQRLSAPVDGVTLVSGENRTENFWVPPLSVLTNTGPTQGHVGVPVSLSATLTDTAGNPLAGKAVNFAIATYTPGVGWEQRETCQATTDVAGAASCVIVPTGPPTTLDLFGLFAGDAEWTWGGFGPVPFTLNAAPPPATLTALGAAHAWVGLKNSDDQGTKFDVQVELLKNGVPVASGLSRCIAGITRNPNLATDTAVPWGAFPETSLSFWRRARSACLDQDRHQPGRDEMRRDPQQRGRAASVLRRYEQPVGIRGDDHPGCAHNALPALRWRPMRQHGKHGSDDPIPQLEHPNRINGEVQGLQRCELLRREPVPSGRHMEPRPSAVVASDSTDCPSGPGGPSPSSTDLENPGSSDQNGWLPRFGKAVPSCPTSRSPPSRAPSWAHVRRVASAGRARSRPSSTAWATTRSRSPSRPVTSRTSSRARAARTP